MTSRANGLLDTSCFLYTTLGTSLELDSASSPGLRKKHWGQARRAGLFLRPKHLCIGGGKGTYFFCLEEIVIVAQELEIDGSVSTIL